MSSMDGTSMDMAEAGGGSGEEWSTFPATTDVDFAGFSALNVGNVEMTGALVFEDGSEQVRGFRDTTLWNMDNIRINSVSNDINFGTTLYDFGWSALGTEAFALVDNGALERFTVNTPYNSAGASLTSASDSLGSLGNVNGFAVNFDISALFFSFGTSGQNDKALQKYNVVVKGDISSGEFDDFIDLTPYFAQNDTIGKVSRHPDGKHFLVCNSTSTASTIILVKLDEKDDLILYTITTMSVASLDQQPQRAEFSEDGQYIIFLGQQHLKLYTIRLKSPFTLQTAISVVGSYTISSEEVAIPASFDLHPLGNHIYITNTEETPNRTVTDFNISYFHETDTRFNKRMLTNQSDNVSIVNESGEGSISIDSGNFVIILDGGGVGQLEYIDNLSWTAGSVVILQLPAGITVGANATSAPNGYGVILLQGGVSEALVTGTFQKMTVVFNGVSWEEVSRTLGITTP